MLALRYFPKSFVNNSGCRVKLPSIIQTQPSRQIHVVSFLPSPRNGSKHFSQKASVIEAQTCLPHIQMAMLPMAPGFVGARRALSTAGDGSPGDVGSLGPDGLGKDFFAPDVPNSFPESTLIDPATAENGTLSQTIGEAAASATAAVAEGGLTGLDAIGYAPSELVMRAVEMLHVSAGLPYWGSIVALTLIVRTCTLPIHISTMRNAAKMAIVRPELDALGKKMQGNLTPQEQMKVSLEMQALFKKHDVHPFRSMIYPFLQLPVFMSMFFGLKEMGTFFPGLATGGIGFIPNLGIADPTYILPVATGLSFLGMVELGSGDMPQNDMSRNMKMFMRLMAVTMPPLTYTLPSGIFVYWMASNTFTLMQSAVLKIPAVKAALGIPEVPPELLSPKVEEVVPEEMKDNFLFKKQTEAISRKSKMQHDILKKAAEMKKKQDEAKK